MKLYDMKEIDGGGQEEPIPWTDAIYYPPKTPLRIKPLIVEHLSTGSPYRACDINVSIAKNWAA